MHSPDPQYVAKLKDIWLKIRQTKSDPITGVLLFQDEFTLYRHPDLAQAYEKAGKMQIKAELGYKGNYTWRIAAAMNLWTGQVVYHHARVMDITRMLLFYRKIVKAFPGQTIWLVQDNWPVHYHPDIIAALNAQDFPYGLRTPRNWSRNPNREVEHLNLPIYIMPLPVYASWTNPIEKLWRLLKHEVLHLHRYEDNWTDLKKKVFSFLDQFSNDSPELLRYVGLQDPLRLYHAVFPAG